MRSAPAWPLLVALGISLMGGCDAAELVQPLPGRISELGRFVGTIEATDGSVPEYEFEGLRILGDFWVSDYRHLIQVTSAQLQPKEQLRIVVNLRALPLSMQTAFYEGGAASVRTCTDCSTGGLGGAGRIFIFARAGSGFQLLRIGDWIS